MKFLNFDYLKDMLLISVLVFLLSSFIYSFFVFSRHIERIDKLENLFDKYICSECGNLKNC